MSSILDEANRRWQAEEDAAKKFDPPAEDSTSLETACAADVQSQPIRWLWPGRIALGKLTVLAGDPGLGKSMLTLGIASHVTRGTAWPVDRSECPQGTVLLVSAEDDIADTIRPRLDAAGADVTRVHILTAVREPDKDGRLKARGLSLREDLAALERKLLDLKDCRLLVIDPVTAYLDGTDSHKNAEVRALLAPLTEVAQRHGVAVIAVTHLNKGGGQSAMYRAMGSLAFVAAARAVFVATKDKDNESRRLVLPVKNNLGNDQTGVAYRIEVADNGAPFVTWFDEAVTVNADEALSPGLPDEERTERDEAANWLRAVLNDGPVKVKELKKLANEDGHAWRTVQRAMRPAGAISERSGFGAGARWRLNDANDAPFPHVGANGANGPNGENGRPETRINTTSAPMMPMTPSVGNVERGTNGADDEWEDHG